MCEENSMELAMEQQSSQLNQLKGKLGKVMNDAEQLVAFGRVVDALDTDLSRPTPDAKATP